MMPPQHASPFPVLPDDVLALAALVADGDEPDWEALAADATTPEQRSFVRRLQVVSHVVRAHRDTATVPGESLLAPGASWGALVVLDHVGSGTFGDVYRAKDVRLDREVALKVLRQAIDAAEPTAATVLHEGQLLARVRHPNVVTVYGADEIDGQVGLWMELVEGQTLEAELVERGPFPVADVAAIGLHLARALSAVHAAGVLHRDVKAQNVMRDRRDGRVVLMDFSAGRPQAPADGLPGGPLPGTLAGSPLYLAPEILAGSRATERSDVYSLGVLLFHVLTGSYPVLAGNIDELRRLHAHAGAASPSHPALGAVPSRLRRVLERALAADAAQRFETAERMAAALERALNGSRRRAGVAALVVLGVATATAGWWVTRPEPPLPFAERDWVLVAPFENRTGDRAFDDIVQPALERELAGSGFVNVVPQARVEDTLALMRKPADTTLDTAVAREVSLRDGGISAIVDGDIVKAGAVLTLRAGIVDPATGATVRTVTASAAGKDDVPRKVGELALGLRRALGESRASLARGQTELAAVTTPSFEALQLYSKAATLLKGDDWRFSDHGRRRFETARELLHQATRVDPDFASAWLLLSHASCALPDPRCLPEAERASALTASVTAVERHFINGFVARRRAYVRGASRQDRLAESARSYEAALQFVPDHYWTLMELITVYRELGRHDDADRIAEHAARIRPHSIRFAVDLARVHLRRGDRAALETLAEDILARLPAEAEANVGDQFIDIAWIRTWRAHDAWLRGDVAAALSALRQAEARWQSDTKPQWLWVLISAYGGLGRFSDAGRISDLAPADLRAFYRTAHAANREDWKAFDLEVKASAPWLEPAISHGFTLSWAGQFARAEQVIAERQKRGLGNWQSVDEMYGQLRVLQGRYAEGVALLEWFTLPELRPRYRAYEIAALGKWRLGDVAGAVQILEPSDRDRFLAVAGPWAVNFWLRCRILLADIYRDIGRVDDAVAVEEDLRRLTAVADADYPVLRRLASRPTRP